MGTTLGGTLGSTLGTIEGASDGASVKPLLTEVNMSQKIANVSNQRLEMLILSILLRVLECQ